MSLRIGQGYDSHRLVKGVPLVIGGLDIEFEMGSLGHSDGDCLLHALIDSLLGALGLGDIGEWFPCEDESIKGIRSTDMLKKILTSEKVPDFDWNNIDMTLFLDKPKLKDYKGPILDSIAHHLQIDVGRLNLKAKTWEGFQVGPLIAASVTSLIEIE